MDRFLWGGWVARPSAFLFLRLRWFLVFGVGVVARVPVSTLSFAVAVLNSFRTGRTVPTGRTA